MGAGVKKQSQIKGHRKGGSFQWFSGFTDNSTCSPQILPLRVFPAFVSTEAGRPTVHVVIQEAPGFTGSSVLKRSPGPRVCEKLWLPGREQRKGPPARRDCF